MTQTFKLIGKPQIESEYCDKHETTMVCCLRREDGVVGDVWIVAGVPGSMRGSSEAARTQNGYCRVWVFGDTPDTWCPRTFRDEDTDIPELRQAVIEACETAALAVHQEAMASLDDEAEGN